MSWNKESICCSQEDQWVIQDIEDLKIQLCDFIDDQVRHHEDGWENTKIQSASTDDGKLHFKIHDVVLTRPDEPNETELLVTIERVGSPEDE